MKRWILGLCFFCLFAVGGLGLALAKAVPPVPEGFDLYAEPIRTAEHLDWLWQEALLKGEKKAIAKLVTALDLHGYQGGIKKAGEIQKKRALTEVEKREAYLDGVFQAAMWSLGANARQHPEVLAELKRVERVNRQDTNPAHAYLLIILSHEAPDEYKLVNEANGLTFSTPSGEVKFKVKK